MPTRSAFQAQSGARLSVQVYEHLRREILAMRLLPHRRLSEAEIALSLGVSRTPVREAFIRLSREGLVDIYPQSGTRVAPIRIAEILTAQFVRESLECAAIRIAAAKASREDAVRLRTILARQSAFQKSGEADLFFQADEDLHRTLMQIAGHDSAWPIVANAKAQLDRVRHLAMRARVKSSAVLREHLVIAEAVIDRKPERAMRALRTHLREIFATTTRIFSENPSLFEERSLPEGMLLSQKAPKP